MRIAPPLSLLALLAFSACSASGSPKLTLISPAVGAGSGIDLATLTIIDDGYDNPAVDFFIQQAMVVSLRGHYDDTFCAKGTKFTALAEIPADPTQCPSSQTWQRFTYLGGSASHPESMSFVKGNGYLVRARDRVTLYKVLVLADSYTEQGTATATLDIERLP
jgi:hypothetical protein